ncbi:MAG: type II secretion system protein [Caldicoprobacteraceae bacterium]
MKEIVKELRMSKRGFTLLELVVVIAILGVLALIVVPNVVDRISEAETTVREANAKILKNALDMYLIDSEGEVSGPANGTSYTEQELKEILVPGYLDEIPKLDGIAITYDSKDNRFIVTTDN